jgi:hypothetical protein
MKKSMQKKGKLNDVSQKKRAQNIIDCRSSKKSSTIPEKASFSSLLAALQAAITCQMRQNKRFWTLSLLFPKSIFCGSVSL